MNNNVAGDCHDIYCYANVPAGIAGPEWRRSLDERACGFAIVMKKLSAIRNSDHDVGRRHRRRVDATAPEPRAPVDRPALGADGKRYLGHRGNC